MIALIAGLGRPLALAYAEKLKTKYKEIGSQEAYKIKEHLKLIENEIFELKSQLKIVQENNDYLVKLIECSGAKSKQIKEIGEKD